MAASKTAGYILSLRCFTREGEYRPDFQAVSRYEGDDFTSRSYSSNYCYRLGKGQIFFNFSGELSAKLKVPLVPWQIPSSSIRVADDEVYGEFDERRWGTPGSYTFGDPGVK